MSNNRDNFNKEAWIKKFGTGLKRSTSNTLKRYMPSIYTTTNSAAQMASDIRKFSAKTLGLNRQHDRELSKTKLGKSANQIFQTAMDDIKNGNFSKKTSDDMFDVFDDDISSDFSYDPSDEDYGELSSDEIGLKGNEAVAKTILASGTAQLEGMESMTKAIMGSHFKTSKAMASALSNTMLHSTNIINRSLLSINDRLGTINENLVSILDFHNNNTNSMIETLNEFSDKSINMLNEIGKMMSSMNVYVDGNMEKGARKFNTRDGFNYRDYVDHVKEGIAKSTPAMYSNMFKSMGGFKKVKEDPIGVIIEEALPKLVPKKIDRSIKELDKNLGLYIEELLNRIGDINPAKNDLGLMMLGLDTIFKGIGNERNKRKSFLSLGSYHKEALPWNGISQKAITEVIPEYLSNMDVNLEHIKDILLKSSINSAKITYDRDNKLYYDYNEGTFKTKRKIREAFKEDLENNYRNYELEEALENTLGLIKSEKMQDKFKKDFTKLYNDMLHDSISNREFTDSIVDMMYMVRREDQTVFRKNIMEIKKSIEEGNKENNQLLSDIANTQHIYRNINNKYGLDEEYSKYSSMFNSTKSINPFSEYSFGAENPLDKARDELESALNYMNLPFEKEEDATKFYKRILSNTKLIKAVYKGMTKSEIEDAIRAEYKAKYGKTIVDKIRNAFSQKVLEKIGMGDLDEKASKSINTFNNFLFKASYGIKDTSDQTPYDKPKLKSSRFDKTKYRVLDMAKKSSVRKLNEKGVEDNIKSSNRIINNAISDLVTTKSPSSVEQAIIESGNANIIATGSILTTLRNMTGLISGGSGNYAKTKIKEKVFETAFDEDKGIFKDGVKKFKNDSRNFLGDIKEDLKDKYNKVYDLTMKTAFGEDYKNSDNWKKYGRWASTDKDDKEQDKATKGTFSEFMDKAKKFAPGIVTAGILGAIIGGPLVGNGALLLPSTLIGGASAAAGLAILSKTEAFQSIMFGKKDDKTGERYGGLISSEMAEKFKKALPFVVGGATLGVLRHILLPGTTSTIAGPFGIIGSALLPTGVIGAAILGAGLAIAKNSDTVKDVLFGKIDPETNKRSGGTVSKIIDKLNAGFHKVLPALKLGIKGLAIGTLAKVTLSGMGLIPAAIASGPIGLGLIGFGAGLLSTSKKFQQYIFGDDILDKDGNPTGKKTSGLLTRAANAVKVNFIDTIAQSFKTNFTKFVDWAKIQLLSPFKMAFGPILDSLLGIKESIVQFVREKFDAITDGIHKMISGVLSKIFSPLGKLVRGFINVSGTLLRWGLQLKMAPVSVGLQALSFLTAGKRRKEMLKYGASYYKELPSFLRGKWQLEEETGHKRSFFGKVKDTIDSYTGRGEIAEASRAGYNEMMGNLGYNHLGWRDSHIEKRQYKEEARRHKREVRMWSKVDEIRGNLSSELGYREVELTPGKIAAIKKQLKRANFNTDAIKTSDDVMDLLYRKWKFTKDKDGQLTPRDGTIESLVNMAKETGIKIIDPEGEAARKADAKYHSTMEYYMKVITSHMGDQAFNKVMNIDNFNGDEESYKKYLNRMANKAKLRGIDINKLDFRSLGFLDQDLLDDDFFDEYRNSTYYERGDFIGFAKKKQNTKDRDQKKAYFKDLKNRQTTIKDILNNNKATSQSNLDRMNSIKDEAAARLGIDASKFNMDELISKSKNLKIADLVKEMKDLLMENNKLAKESTELEKESVENLSELKTMGDIDLQIATEGKLSAQDIQKRKFRKGGKIKHKTFKLSGGDLDEFKLTESEMKEGFFSSIAKTIAGKKKEEKDEKVREGSTSVATTIPEKMKEKIDNMFGKAKNAGGGLVGKGWSKAKEFFGGPLGSKLLTFAKGYMAVAGLLGMAETISPGSNDKVVQKARDIGLQIENNNIYERYIIPMVDSVFSNLGNSIKKLGVVVEEKWYPVILPAITSFIKGAAASVPKMVEVAEVMITNLLPAIVEASIRVIPKVLGSIGSGLWNATMGTIFPALRINVDESGKVGFGKKSASYVDVSGKSKDEIDAIMAEERSKGNAVTYDPSSNQIYYTGEDSNTVAIDEDGNAIISTSDGKGAYFAKGVRNAAMDMAKASIDKRSLSSKLLSKIMKKPSAWGKGFFKALAMGTGGLIGGGIGFSTGLSARLIPFAGTALGGYGGLKGAARGARYFANAGGNLVDNIINRKTISDIDLIKKVASKSGMSKVGIEALEQSNKTMIKFFADKLRASGRDLAKNKGIVKRICKVANCDEEAAKKILQRMEKSCIELADELPGVIAKNPKLGNKLIKSAVAKLAKGASKAIPFLNIAFIAYDALSGLAEADRLFGVKPEDVDGNMRIVSGLMKLFLGLGPNVIIDIALEIHEAVTGNDVKQKIAVGLYKVLSQNDAEKLAKLNLAQAEMRSDYEEYLSINPDANISFRDYVNYENQTVMGSLVTTKAEKEHIKNKEKVLASKGYGRYKSTSVGKGTGRKAVGFGGGKNSQTNSRWANLPIGTMPDGSVSTMGTGGCGPTSLSVVANQFGINTNPAQMGKYASTNGYISQGGANAGLFTEGAAKLGLKSSTLTSGKDIAHSMLTNTPTIISGRGGSGTPFTDAGHIVVGRGFNKHGRMLIEDPMDGKIKSYSPRSVLNNATGGWAYGYGGGIAYNVIYDRSIHDADYLKNRDKTNKKPLKPFKNAWYLMTDPNFTFIEPIYSSEGPDGITPGSLQMFARTTNRNLYNEWLKAKKAKGYRSWYLAAVKDFNKTVPKYKKTKGLSYAAKKQAMLDNLRYDYYKENQEKDKFFNTRQVIERILVKYREELNKKNIENLRKYQSSNALSDDEMEEALSKLYTEDPEKHDALVAIAEEEWYKSNEGEMTIKFKYDFITKYWDKDLDDVKSDFGYRTGEDLDYTGFSFNIGHDRDSVLAYLQNAGNGGIIDALNAFKAFFVGTSKGFLGEGNVWDSAATEIESYERSKLSKLAELDSFGGVVSPSNLPITINSKEIIPPKKLQVSAVEFGSWSRDKRVKAMSEFAKELGMAASIPPSLIIGAGIQESGLGDNASEKLAGVTNNLYGVRAVEGYDSWTSSKGKKWTKYNNVGDSMLHFAKIMTLPYYKDVVDAKTTDTAYAAFANSPYCEGGADKVAKYYNSLKLSYGRHNLEKLDSEAIGWGEGPKTFADALNELGREMAMSAPENSATRSLFSKFISSSNAANSNRIGGNIGSSISISANNAVSYMQRALGGAMITSPFGKRKHPVTGKEGSMHNGVDLGARSGTNIYSPVSGTVTVARPKDSYGNLVVVKDRDGYSHYFAHQSQMIAKEGDSISKGGLLGKVGSTGRSTGPHLHYGIKNPGGHYINPTHYSLSSLGYGNPRMMNSKGKVNLDNFDIMTVNTLKQYGLNDEDIYYGYGASSVAVGGPRAIINTTNVKGVEEKLDMIAAVLTDWKKEGVGSNINIVNSGNTNNNINGVKNVNNKQIKPLNPQDLKSSKLAKMHEVLAAI